MTAVTFKFIPKMFTKTYSIKALCPVHKNKKTNRGQQLFSMQELHTLASSCTAHAWMSHQSAPASLELAQETFAGPLLRFGSCASNAVPAGLLFSRGQHKDTGGSGAVACPQWPVSVLTDSLAGCTAAANESISQLSLLLNVVPWLSSDEIYASLGSF